YLAPYDSYANRVAILRFVQDIPMHPSHPTYRLVEEIGRGLTLFKDHPMLIIWGALDWCFTTDFLKEWQTRFPKAEVRLVPDAGHYVVEDAHERIIPWVREFLPSIRSRDDARHETLLFVQGDNRETPLTMSALTSQTETTAEPALLNIAAHLPLMADRRPDQPAVIHPHIGAHLTFRQLNEECDRY